MTREQAERLVARGVARWFDDDTLEIKPGPPLLRPDGSVDHEASPSTVRFVGKPRATCGA